ncbi:MAG: CBS domain-containing protein [Agarilytica sp.]
MAVKKIMTDKLVTVSPNDTVEHMQNILEKYNIHHLLVIDNENLVGVISDRDILRIISPYINTKVETEKDLFTLTRTASQLMTKKPITISPQASIRDAAKSLLDNKVSLLPVVNDDGNAIGVLSWKDVMRYIID